jgi:tripartite-type tricarboxylate transporter receptor subunit TctC
MMRLIVLLSSLLAAAFAGTGLAQGDYPAKPIRMVVGFPPGGGNDILARLLSAKLQETWGQPVVVENRPGAASNIATEFVAKAPPDGYTLLFNAAGMVINPALYASIPFDPVRDFEPVSQLASFPFVLVVHPSVPAQSVKELVQLAKSRPGKLNYSAGAAAFQLAAELFKQQAGIDLNHVPYKGSVQAISAVLANEVQLTFVDSLPVIPHIKSGKLRGLAVTPGRRTSSLPELPTMKEAGLPDFELAGWAGLFAPARTPKAVVSKLHQQSVRIVHLPDIRARMLAMGAEPTGTTPEELTALMKIQLEKWKTVAKIANIKAE